MIANCTCFSRESLGKKERSGIFLWHYMGWHFKLEPRGSLRPCFSFPNEKLNESSGVMGGRRVGMKRQSKITHNIWCSTNRGLLEGRTYNKHWAGLARDTFGTKGRQNIKKASKQPYTEFIGLNLFIYNPLWEKIKSTLAFILLWYAMSCTW